MTAKFDDHSVLCQSDEQVEKEIAALKIQLSEEIGKQKELQKIYETKKRGKSIDHRLKWPSVLRQMKRITDPFVHL